MKVIDLLNSIANGEEVPKKIKYNGIEYKRCQNQNSNKLCYYQRVKSPLMFLIADLKFSTDLNKEIEIIEEDKKIEYCKGYECFDGIDDYIEHLRDKIDDLIDEVNILKEKE